MSKHFVGSRLHRASHRSVLINRTTAIVLFAIVLAMNYGPLRTGRFFRILGESSERRLLSIGKAVFGFHLGINLGIHLENIQVERIHMSERSSSWKVSTRQTLKLALNPNSKSIWSFKWSERNRLLLHGKGGLTLWKLGAQSISEWIDSFEFQILLNHAISFSSWSLPGDPRSQKSALCCLWRPQ